MDHIAVSARLLKMLRLMSDLNRHQHRSDVHPYTCGNDSNHGNLYPVLDDGKVVLLCPDCDYRQEMKNE